MTTRTLFLSSLLATSLLATACGTQTDDDYDGERLFRAEGRVINDLPAAPSNAEVTLFWLFQGTSSNGDPTTAESAHVEGSFPASFTLDLFRAPTVPDDSYPLGAALILAVDPDTFDPSGDEGVGLYGLSETHVMVWSGQPFDAWIPEDQETIAYVYGSEVSEGYSLFEVVELDRGDGSGMPLLAPAPDDASVTVRLAPVDELAIPDLK